MTELYHLIASCNPNRQTLILTALEGEAKGEKAFVVDGVLQWESKKGGYSPGCLCSRYYYREQYPDLL